MKQQHEMIDAMLIGQNPETWKSADKKSSIRSSCYLMLLIS